MFQWRHGKFIESTCSLTPSLVKIEILVEKLTNYCCLAWRVDSKDECSVEIINGIKSGRLTENLLGEWINFEGEKRIKCFKYVFFVWLCLKLHKKSKEANKNAGIFISCKKAHM